MSDSILKRKYVDGFIVPALKKIRLNDSKIKLIYSIEPINDSLSCNKIISSNKRDNIHNMNIYNNNTNKNDDDIDMYPIGPIKYSKLEIDHNFITEGNPLIYSI
mmetsp:Transcript_91514/g.112056  ORF Transcript_91514/g.112056 Transcript_91514/m.112056 type:complete len:104 (-) Transcript_91514:89-400(-)